MKTNNPNRANRLAVWLSLALALLGVRAQALDVVDPTGTNYTGVSDSSEYSSQYVGANLFNEDVTGIPLGSVLTGGQWATAGQATAFLAFQVEKVYTNVGSIFYAQRAGGNPVLDKINTIYIWASDTNAFSASDPGTPPNSVVQVTNLSGALWEEYLLTNQISGQYFLIEILQSSAPTAEGNPGGSQFRLGAALALPPSIVTPPANVTLYSGGTCRFFADAAGTAPLTYTWSFGGSTLTNGGRYSGADTGNLVIAGIASADVGVYTLSVSNSEGSANVTASLAVVPPPTNAADVAIISRGPLAYWQLNEPSGATNAFDYVGSFNGTYGADSITGVPGPQAPGFPGFGATNTALETTGYDLNSPATVPALNISTNDSVSIIAWINPTQQSDQPGGDQEPYTGIVFWRNNLIYAAAGLIFDAGGTNLGYQWDGNEYQFESGLTPPLGQWTMVGLVYTGNATTLYMGSSNGVVLSAVDNTPERGQSFNSPMSIGIDTDVGESTRTFNGEISDVAFFTRALTSGDMSAIYAAATGINPVLTITGESATNVAVSLGEPTTMSVQTSGLAPQFQWYDQGARIAGATNDMLTISGTLASQSGNYYVVVTNIYGGSVTSAVISLTVSNYVVLPIGPSGVIYSNISDSSDYPAGTQYIGSNLFNEDVTGVPVGSILTGGEWATASQATAYLAFQVDQSYSVNAIFYAQRAGSNPLLDKISEIDIWATNSGPFTAGDPGTPPDAVVPITDVNGAQWEYYLLTNEISGQYFLIEITQSSAPTVEGNPGGTQFRLGGTFTPVLNYSNSAAGLTLNWPIGVVVTLQQAPTLSGPWTSATGITNGVPIPFPALGNQQMFYRLQY
ncbi:MAG TPA: immunoglobulin domain-containing protein [Verrucomicrobiae bacterium]|nr:immunoglobulin domain-containing protein [Verrucomicrobiae bacterium]